jgi:hypothetical protein
MPSSSRTLKNPWLLAVFGLWSLLAISLAVPFTVHAAAIVPMGKTPPPIEKTPPVDNSQPISITIRNATNNLMKFTGSSLSGTVIADVKPGKAVAFDTQGTPGWATWILNGSPKAPTIKVSWDGSDPWNGPYDWSGSSSGIVSIPRGAAQFGTSMIEEDNHIQETFTVHPK